MALWLVTRPEEDSRRTSEALEAVGHRCVAAPLIEIDGSDPDAVELEGVQALLFTSANGVRAFSGLSDRRDLPVMAVGAASAAEARQAGFSRVVSADGDADALADLAIRTCDPMDGALFHAAGKDTAGDLSARLTAAGFDVRRRVLYRARPADRLPDAAIRTLDDPSLAGILFFSPRTARTFDRLVREAGLTDRLKRLIAVCLSPAVAGRLDRDAWADVRIAERPDMDALVARLEPPPPPSVTTDSERMASRDEKSEETKPEGIGAPADSPAKPDAAPLGAPSTEPEAQEDAGATVPPDPPEEEAAGGAAGKVIDLFGGIRPMAAKIGAPVTTVQGWKKRGHIPPGRQDEIREAAAEHNIDLDPDLLAAAITESEEAERAQALAEGTATEVEAAEVTGADTVSAAEAKPEAGDRDQAESEVKPWGATAVATEPEATPSAAERPEPDSAPASEPERERSYAPTPPPAEPAKSGRGIAWLALIVAIVAGGGALWLVYARPPANLPGPPDRVTELQQQIASLEDRIPAVVEPADDGLSDRIAALEQQVADVGGQAGEEEMAAIDARLADIEGRIDAVGEAGEAAGPAVADLADRVAALEQFIREGGAGDGAAASAAAADAVTQAQERIDTLAEQLGGRLEDLSVAMESVRAASEEGDAALAERIDSIAGQADPLVGQLETLASRVEELAGSVDRVSASDSATQALVLAIGQLRDSLQSGPFADALARVRALVGDDEALTAALDEIAPMADTGIPTRAMLTARYPQVAREIRQAAAGEREGDWLDRSLAAVQGLVTVRREDGEVEGDDAGAITARASGRLERDNLSGAVEALSALDGAAADAAGPWLSDARARLAAEAALDRLTLAAVDRLGGLAGVETAPAPAEEPPAEEAEAGGNG